jgi:septum formation protein
VIRVPVPVVLASSSPTRRGLLATLVQHFDVVAPSLNEAAVKGDHASALALRLAEAKAREGALQRPDALVIAADTLVLCENEIIGKPADFRDAVRILEKLTRTRHKVLTALFLIAPDARERSRCVESSVWMRRMSRREIEEYLARRGGLDKAGAYALTPNDPYVERVEGSMTGVMGLPLEELAEMIRSLYPESGEQS